MEQEPSDHETLARIFRTLHTVKGTAGFLGLAKLQSIAHAGENLLGWLRAGELSFHPAIATALLGVVDAIRQILQLLETTEGEGDGDYTDLIRTLERLTRGSKTTEKPWSAPGPVSPPAPGSLPTGLPAAPPIGPTAVVVGPARVTLSPPPPPLPAASPTSPPISLVTPEPTEVRTPAVADTSIRVDVGLLDQLMNLVGELVLARNQIMQFGSEQVDAAFLNTVQRLNVLTSELQAGVMKTRMQPIGNVWAKMPRIVRDLAIACGKQVRLDMDGQETELDKTILEAIRDPLTHLIRNAVDHGIEPPAERQAKGKPTESTS